MEDGDAGRLGARATTDRGTDGETTAVVWFRRDLRLHDNAVLSRAADADRLVPLLVLDPADSATREYGGRDSFASRRTGIRRLRFRLEAAADLRASLRAVGSDLLVRVGEPTTVVPELADAVGADTVHHASYDVPEERTTGLAVTSALADAGIGTRSAWTHTLVHPADLPDGVRGVPDTYTPFRQSVEDDPDASPRDPVPTPEIPPLPSDVPAAGEIPTPEEILPAQASDDLLPDGVPEPAVVDASDRRPDDDLVFTGGESAGLARLREYLWETDALAEYKETRNGLSGRNYASKLSPWLNAGCLSPRLVASEVDRYERERVANDSTYWLVFELLWRDFFAFQVAKHGGRFFAKGGIRERDDIEWVAGETERRRLTRWAAGETGVPFVDAGIRELNATGYLSNRARKNVASYAVNDCRIDWRKVGAVFERRLVDYDPCSNYGNVAYIAGVGNDSRNRSFDLRWQATEYDPDAAYVKRWVPELADLPPEHAHAPWEAPDTELTAHDVELGVDYPEPVVEP